MADKNHDFPQDKEMNEYRYLSNRWLDEIAIGLTKGAEKHPGETWRTIPCNEHLARALRHINLYLMGDRTEPHITNASMRLMMACETEQQYPPRREYGMGESVHAVILRIRDGAELHRYRRGGLAYSAIVKEINGKMTELCACERMNETKLVRDYLSAIGGGH